MLSSSGGISVRSGASIMFWWRNRRKRFETKGKKLKIRFVTKGTVHSKKLSLVLVNQFSLIADCSTCSLCKECVKGRGERRKLGSAQGVLRVGIPQQCP